MSKFINILWLIILSCFATCAFAQQSRIDSLEATIKYNVKSDSVKIQLLNELAEIYVLKDVEKAKLIAQEIGDIAKRTNLWRAQYYSKVIKAHCFQIKLLVDSALLYYDIAQKIATAEHEDKFAKIINGNIASILLIKGKSKEAIDLLKETIAYFEATNGNAHQGKFLVNLANMYNFTGDRVLALSTALKALQINVQIGDLNAITASNYLIGSLYGSSSQFAEALQYHTNYAAIQKKLGNWSQACIGLIAVANDYKQLKKQDSAVIVWKEALEIAQLHQLTQLENKIILNLNTASEKKKTEIETLLELEKQFEASGNNTELGLTYCKLARANVAASATFTNPKDVLKEERNEIAFSYAIKAFELAQKSKNYSLVEESYRVLSMVYEVKNNFAKAYEYYKQYIDLRDSAINESKQLEISKLNMQFGFDRKADSLKLIQAATDADLQKQYFLNKQQQQNLALRDKELQLDKQTILSNKQNIAILSKDKELQHLAYLKQQAELQAEQLSKKEKEQLLNIAENDKALANAKVKSISQENENNKLKRKQLLFYGAATLATLLFTGLLLYNRNRNKQIQLKAALATQKAQQELVIAEAQAKEIAQQLREVQLQQNLTEVTLSALRSQMNPHFIFNSLNSINSVVIEGNIPMASDYLTKFSKLIRLILDHSKSSLIPLGKELEALRLYLLMEKIRFHNKFEYEIIVANDVDIEKLNIPPTTLQPFVENAIIHGLMHATVKGMLKVNICTLLNNAVEISISDNGIGRKKSAELKSRTNLNKSHGLDITKQRLMQLHAKNSIEILDIVDDELQASGTIVVIKMYA